MIKKIQILKNAAQQYGVEISEEHANQFISFEKFLKEYNVRTNLVSSNDIEFIWEKHFVDSLAFCRCLKNDKHYTILDIGSGGGFPAIIEGIMLTKSKIIALDATTKKVLFLKQAAEKIGLSNFQAINARAEELAHRKTYREKFNIVTSRAVGNLALISELALPFLMKDGLFIAYKSAKLEKELELAQNTIKILGGKVLETFNYNLELEEKFSRSLVIIKKTAPTPEVYPRNYSTIKNKPL